jgi:hypothetical protein
MSATLSVHSQRLVTCPHCAVPDASCCQCHGSRIVPVCVAEKSCVWVWAFQGCACGACQRLRRMREGAA